MKTIKLKAFFLTLIAVLMVTMTSAQEQSIVLKTSLGDINGVLLKPVSTKKIPVVLIVVHSIQKNVRKIEGCGEIAAAHKEN